MIQVFHRPEWQGEPYAVGDLFRLHKDACGRQLEAAGRLLTHQLGWELRLDIAGALQRSQVCRSQEEVLDTCDEWKARLVDKGWA